MQEVARIEAEMDTLLKQVGLATGSVQQRTQALQARMAFPDTAEGREATMARIQSYLDDALVRSAALFDKTPVIAQPYPEFRWASAAATYTRPPLDGSRPGIFQMPLRPDRLTDFELRTLVYHETVPGHHFQLALNLENTDLPRFMQVVAYGSSPAITEGWALYAERVAAESGWYEGDIEGLIGQLKFVELRERARAALGERFSLRAYHGVVLTAGIVPLNIMEDRVNDWIATTLADPAATPPR